MTKEEDKIHYEKGDNKWLEDKIKREEDSIKFNTSMIKASKYDIEICKEILSERKRYCKFGHEIFVSRCTHGHKEVIKN